MKHVQPLFSLSVAKGISVMWKNNNYFLSCSHDIKRNKIWQACWANWIFLVLKIFYVLNSAYCYGLKKELRFLISTKFIFVKPFNIACEPYEMKDFSDVGHASIDLKACLSESISVLQLWPLNAEFVSP